MLFFSYLLTFRNVTTENCFFRQMKVATFEPFDFTIERLRYMAAILIQSSDSDKSFISVLSTPQQQHNDAGMFTE